MTKSKSAYVGTPEVTAAGITPKSKRPAGNGKVQVTHKREARGKTWLRTYVGTVIVVDALVGLTMIYGALDDPELVRTQAHAMWLFGTAHLAAVIPVLFNKLE